MLCSLGSRRQNDGGIDAKNSLLGRRIVAALESFQAVIVTGLVSYREQVKKVNYLEAAEEAVQVYVHIHSVHR